MAAKFRKVICSAITFIISIDIYPSRVDPPTVSEKGAENVPNQPMRRECSATRDFFDSQDIDKAGYSWMGVKYGLGVATRNDERPDAQSRVVFGAQSVRISVTMGARYLRLNARSLRRTRDHAVSTHIS